jgi:hypothetical protein
MTDEDDIRLFNELMSTQPGEQIEGLRPVSEPLRGSLHRKARPQRREAQADPRRQGTVTREATSGRVRRPTAAGED